MIWNRPGHTTHAKPCRISSSVIFHPRFCSTLSVVSFSVGSTTYSVGTTATIAGVGTITMAANGDYTFTPNANWNGTVPQVSYTTNTGSTSTLDITVTPVDDASVLAALTPPQAIEALQKLCHDLLAHACGAAPRYFVASDLPAAPPLAALAQWSKSLVQAARTAEHPFNAGLMLEALVAQAQQTLHSAPLQRPSKNRP